VSLRPLALAALAALVALACTSTERPRPDAARPAPSEPVAAPVELEPTPPPAELPESDLPWVWYHTYPAVLADAFSQVGSGPVAHDHRVGDRRRYTARRDDHGIELILERLPEPGVNGEPVLAWSRRVTTTTAGDPVVQATSGVPAQVVVALRVPGGYERHAFADDGTPRSSFIGIDPRNFDVEGGALQLGGTSERPIVYVRSDSWAYLDEIDPATGKVIARAEVGPHVLFGGFSWPPKGHVGQLLGHCWPVRGGGGCYEARRRGEALELRAVDLAGAERWSVTLDPKGGAWSSRAAVLEAYGGVVVVAYHGAASGATAYGVDPEQGTLRFTTSPGSIGSIGHSKYSNEVALVLGDDDLVRVHGHEAGGDYIGLLDPKTGSVWGHEVWRR
jgi:hypothetical protein